MKTVAALLGLWQQLYLHIPLPGGQRSGDKGRRAQLQVMMQFIHANFNRQITLQEIAQSVHISESSALQLFRRGIYFCRTFRKFYGQTATEYRTSQADRSAP